MQAGKPIYHDARTFIQAWYKAHSSPFYICSLQIYKYCPVILTKRQTTLDHIVPISIDDRYKFDFDNIQTACRHCNSMRANKDVPRWYVMFGTVPPYRYIGKLALIGYSTRRRKTNGRPAAASVASISTTSTNSMPTIAVSLGSTLNKPKTGADWNNMYAASKTVDIDSMGETPFISLLPSVYNHFIKGMKKTPPFMGSSSFVLSCLFF